LGTRPILGRSYQWRERSGWIRDPSVNAHLQL